MRTFDYMYDNQKNTFIFKSEISDPPESCAKPKAQTMLLMSQANKPTCCVSFESVIKLHGSQSLGLQRCRKNTAPFWQVGMCAFACTSLRSEGVSNCDCEAQFVLTSCASLFLFFWKVNFIVQLQETFASGRHGSGPP